MLAPFLRPRMPGRLELSASVCFALAASTAVSAVEADVFEGQVACSQCWHEADRRTVAYGTPSDLECAKECADAGVPLALAVRNESDGSFELLLLPSDPVPGSRPWSELVARFVRVTGRVREADGMKSLEVGAVHVLEHGPWPTPGSQAEPSTTAPAELSWVDLTGHRWSLSDLAGRVVVLNFWGTWCVPCRDEMPELVRLQDRHGLLGVQVVGAAADAPTASADVSRFARQLRLNFPVLLGADTEQMRALGLGVALPATVVLDREGKVVERFDGVFRREALESAVERALGGTAHAAEHEEPAPHVHVARTGPAEASLVPS